MSSQPILLIVDDKPSNLKVLFEFLKQTGYRTLAAQSGQDAIMLAEQSLPDLVLLDVMMPEMDGYETCRRLKDNPRTKDIPVLFMTALSDTEHKLKAFEAGAIDFITKPLQHDEVLARVNAHVQLTALRRETEDFLSLLLRIAHQKDWKGVLDACGEYLSQRPDIQCVAFWQRHDQSETSSLQLEGFVGEATSPDQWVCNGNSYAQIDPATPFLSEVLDRQDIITSDESVEWQESRPAWAVANGFEAFTAVPLKKANNVIGIMAVFYTVPLQERLPGIVSRLRIFSNYLITILFNIRELNRAQQTCSRLQEENQSLREEISTHAFQDIIGSSPALTRTLKQVELAAPTEASILISGESGTGKELIAQAIHRHSNRKDAPFITVNCAAIPRELFESEFFGHIKGAFTGAVQNRKGRFQLADGGTIFLDEVGEIPIDLQGKLLRVVQQGTFERIGEEKTHTVDVRIIAATNRYLKKEIQEGRFREDLYFRLSVIPIEVPPLRERENDILLLARYFILQTKRKLGISPPKLTPDQEKYLLQYNWPGNIRELQNEIERAVILSRNGQLSLNAAPAVKPNAPLSQSTDRIIPEPEWDILQKENIIRALEASDWRVEGENGAAELLQLRPTTLRSRMKTMQISRVP